MSASDEVVMVEDLDGLRALKSEWNELAPPKQVEPWQSFSWMEAAATAYSADHLLRVITIRQNGKLKAVAPMVLKPCVQPLRPLRLDFIGGEELKEPNAFIGCAGTSMEMLADVIAAQRVYPIRLSRIPGDLSTIRCFKSTFTYAGWITATLSMPYPYVDLKTYRIKSSLREELRRAGRKAEAFGEVCSQTVCASNQEELMKHLEIAFGIESSGWKGRNQTAIVSNASNRRFFERYAASAWKDGTLRLSFLLIGRTPVAVQYAVESSNAYWLLKIGYDDLYKECSPGKLLVAESIKDATDHGLLRYNFLGKEEPWTQRWTTSAQNCVILSSCRPNLHGLLGVVSDALYLAKKRIRRKAPTGRPKDEQRRPAAKVAPKAA